MAPDSKDPNDPAEEARLRRLRLLRRGMENLGRFEPFRAEPASPTPAPTDPAEAELAEQIERRFQKLGNTQDHFEVLDLARGAGRDAAKAAFLTLVKQFHPDRLPPSLAHLSSKLNAIFEQLRGAQEVLCDEARRVAYLDTLSEAERKAKALLDGGVPAQAAELFRQAELALRRKDLTAAEALYERAHGLDPKPLYLAAQGWALYLDLSRKSESDRAKALIASALKGDPSCDRAAYQLGVIAKMEGEVDRAERLCRDAVRLNPRHLEAQQELRLIEMRRGKGARGPR